MRRFYVCVHLCSAQRPYRCISCGLGYLGVWLCACFCVFYTQKKTLLNERWWRRRRKKRYNELSQGWASSLAPCPCPYCILHYTPCAFVYIFYLFFPFRVVLKVNACLLLLNVFTVHARGPHAPCYIHRQICVSRSYFIRLGASKSINTHFINNIVSSCPILIAIAFQ